MQVLAKSYLEQVEDCERAIATKKLFAEKIQYLGRLLLDDDFSPLEIETDEFYSRLESKIDCLRRSKLEIGYRLARIGSTFLGAEIASPPSVSDEEYGQMEKKAYNLKHSLQLSQNEVDSLQEEIDSLKDKYGTLLIRSSEVAMRVQEEMAKLVSRDTQDR
jgi:hypothetical protein